MSLQTTKVRVQHIKLVSKTRNSNSMIYAIADMIIEELQGVGQGDCAGVMFRIISISLEGNNITLVSDFLSIVERKERV